VDWLTFAVKLAEALAWPLVVFCLVFLLRKELRGLLAILKKLKAGPVEAEFDRDVKELQSAAEAALPAPEERALPSPINKELLQLAQINPRAAIIEAWRGVEFASRQALSQAGISLSAKESISPLALSRALAKSGALSPEEIALYNDIRGLRNRAVHAEDFSPTLESTLGYIEIAARIRSVLERAASSAQNS
jgi:hypothetical protein